MLSLLIGLIAVLVPFYLFDLGEHLVASLCMYTKVSVCVERAERVQLIRFSRLCFFLLL